MICVFSCRMHALLCDCSPLNAFFPLLESKHEEGERKRAREREKESPPLPPLHRSPLSERKTATKCRQYLFHHIRTSCTRVVCLAAAPVNNVGQPPPCGRRRRLSTNTAAAAAQQQLGVGKWGEEEGRCFYVAINKSAVSTTH